MTCQMVLALAFACTGFAPCMDDQKVGDQEQAVDREPLGLQSFEESADYEVLDSWRETVGLGVAARTYVTLKVRNVDSGEVKTVRSAPEDNQLIELRNNFLQPADEEREDANIKIAPSLRGRFEALREAEAEVDELPVIVWLSSTAVREATEEAEVEDGGVEQGPELQGVRAPEAENEEERQARLEEVLRRVKANRKNIENANHKAINDFLEDHEIDEEKVIYKYSQAPAVVLRLTWEETQKLAQVPDAKFLYPTEQTTNENDVNIPAALGPTIWNEGQTGTGVPIAVVGEAGRIATENPNLNATVRLPESSTDAHATAIAGIIASTHDDIRGIAFNCTLLDASRDGPATNVSVDAAADWALANGGIILSCSQGWHQTDDGSLHWSDIYFDYVVHHSRVLFVKSAGNRGDTGDHGRVTSPGRGYNSLAVGNIDDHGTTYWFDDTMRNTSSYVNPATGTEKPEIAAYGSTVTSTTTSSPWTGGVGSGTSYAAPLVAGIAGLCVQRSPELADEPQALKAIIMASGLAHNIEGDTVPSEHDGAGAALATAVRAGFYVRTLTPSDFGPDGTFEIPVDIPLSGGDPKRIVLVYTHPPTSENADPSVSSYLRSDLDLELYVGGNRVALSTSGDRNPYEIIDYTPTATGSGRVRIRRTAWNGEVDGLRIGIAHISRSTLGQPPNELEDSSLNRIANSWQSLSPAAREAILRILNESEAEAGRRYRSTPR